MRRLRPGDGERLFLKVRKYVYNVDHGFQSDSQNIKLSHSDKNVQSV